MIIKIDKQERQQLEKICSVFELSCRIFTAENNQNIVQAEILHSNGSELQPSTAWYLCASTQLKAAMS
jgi:hypothetical protein